MRQSRRRLPTQPMFQLIIDKRRKRSVSPKCFDLITIHHLAKAPAVDAETAKISAQNATNFSLLHQIVDFMKKRHLAQVRTRSLTTF